MCGDGKESIRALNRGRPIPVITEDHPPSPHPFLDPVLPRSSIKLSEEAIYFKATREEQP